MQINSEVDIKLDQYLKNKKNDSYYSSWNNKKKKKQQNNNNNNSNSKKTRSGCKADKSEASRYSHMEKRLQANEEFPSAHSQNQFANVYK